MNIQPLPSSIPSGGRIPKYHVKIMLSVVFESCDTLVEVVKLGDKWLLCVGALVGSGFP